MYPIFISNQKVINGAAMTANISSGAQNIQECTHFAVQSTWSGTSPVGSLTVQASNDGINWDTVDTFAVSTNSGTHVYNSPLVGYVYTQVNYTFTSGTGTLTSLLSQKAR